MTTKTLQQALKSSKKAANKGFTLVELLIVVVILGILSGVALPNFIKQRDKAKVGAANAAAAAPRDCGAILGRKGGKRGWIEVI